MFRFPVIAAGVGALAGLGAIALGAPIPGAVMLFVSLLWAAALIVFSLARGIWRTVRDWASLLSDGVPRSIRLISIEPPAGWLLNRDATVEVEVTGSTGRKLRHTQEVPIPPLQAFAWRKAGVVPGPFDLLTTGEEISWERFRKRARRLPGRRRS